MDKNQNLTSFQELTTTELNQITGGGWWENFLYSVNRYSHNITQGLHPANTTIKNKIEIQELSVLFSSFCIHHSKYLTERLDLDR